MYAMEMQSIPKHGPNRVYKTREQAERAKRASEKIKMPPLTYVPLRPQRKLFLKPGEKENYLANERKRNASIRLNRHRLSLSRGLLLVFIALNNTVVIVLLLVSLALGSGTVWESVFQIPNWLSVIIIAFNLVHRLKDRMFETIKLRNYAIYTALLVLALCNAVLFTIRIQKGLLCRDFSALEAKSCHASQFLVAISFLTAALAVAGNVTTFYYSKIERPVDQVPEPLHDPFTDYNIPLKHWNPKYTVFYEDLPPPPKVQSEDLRNGWVDVPLYVQYRR
ncbi:hypothetical protein J3R30DRAFT_3695981 [Lentinula aciculospora]|uniref:Uncharacterized protein n=1 Tax=Lentinula aciculospora TaxID=153920 RepID=A0A9W9ASB4_9AGAR|nr:hypothetical protein J3R30DRAFT_3695981 [Lentinula aciculospora]